MPIILKVDPNTGTIYTDNGTTTTTTTGTCLVMAGSPIGAIPGVQGNLALDSTSGQVYLCTVTGSTAATATWIAAFSQNNQPNVFTDTQTIDLPAGSTANPLTLGVNGSTVFYVNASGDVLAIGNLSYKPYVTAPTASGTIPTNQNVIEIPGTLTAAITRTLPTNPAVGTKVRVYGSASAYSVTVNTGVTSGSPYLRFADDSTAYSWVIPASSPGAFADFDWDATNWKITTFGQTVVAPATAPNQAVALGQVANVAPIQIFTVGGTTANTTYSNTVSFTAPCAGYVLICCFFGNNDGSTTLGDITQGLLVNGTSVLPVETAGNNTGWLDAGISGLIAAGTAITAVAQYTVGATALSVGIAFRGFVQFIPSP